MSTSKKRRVVPDRSASKTVEIIKEGRVDSAIKDMIGIIEKEIIKYQTKAQEGGLTTAESKIIRDHTETLLRIKRDQQTSRKNNSLSDMSDKELDEAENAIESRDGDLTD